MKTTFCSNPLQKFAALVCVLEILFLILYALFTDFENEDTAPGPSLYPMFQDIHVMIFVGFGFLMTFLKRYGFSSVGLNFMIAALMLQWGILNHAFWYQVGNGAPWHKIHIAFTELIEGDFAVATVLITFGALLGKISPVQLVIVGFFEIIFFGINYNIGAVQFKAVDTGDSMFVHAFGAYFGLAASFVLTKKSITKNNELNTSEYRSDLFAMIGTLFLWLFWPSYNAALAAETQQYRAVVCTVLALCASCSFSFISSCFLRPSKKFDMIDIQNASLAGGVIVGSASLLMTPWSSILTGCLSGLISVIGYVYISPQLEQRLGVYDTCGVHNLHGIPGALAGVISVFYALTADTTLYGKGIEEIYPARDPAGQNRSRHHQALYQFLALIVTIGIAVVGGLVTGLLAKWSAFDQPTQANQLFHDHLYWEVPQDIEDELENNVNNEGSLENEQNGIVMTMKQCPIIITEEKNNSHAKMQQPGLEESSADIAVYPLPQTINDF